MWLKDGREIDKTISKIELKSTLTHTSLTVRDSSRVDGGHFVLILSNAGGTTSIPVNVKVLDKPGPPDGPLKVKVLNAEKCTLHWTPPLNDGGDHVSHYILERRETSRVTWTIVDDHVDAVSYKVTKLVPGKEYIFRIAAVNKFGVGEFLESDPFIAQNPFTTPGPPSIPVASAVTGDSVILTWERPGTDGGSEIDGFIVEKRDKDGVRWTRCNRRRLNDLRFRCTGLIEGHCYQFRVLAENAAGMGEPSEPSDYIKICEAVYPPGPPTNLKVTDYSGSTVSLSWSKPIYDGGVAVIGFVVEMKEATDDEWTSCTPSTCIEETSFTVKRLRENPVKVSEVPLCPGKITLIDVTSNSAKLTWEKPEHDGGSKIISYIVEMQTKGDDAWNMCSEGRALEVTVNGLNEGNEYFFRVSALNEKGKSEPTPLLTSVKIKDTSTVPVITLLSNTFNVKAGDDLRIDVPLRGVPIPTATWKKDGNILKETSKVNVLTSDTAAHLAIKDATRSDIGMYEVTLINSVGTTSNDVEPPKVILDEKFKQAVLVKAGDLLRIEAHISGRPNPTVHWLKNGRNIATKGRVEILTTKLQTSLTIKECVRKDSGQYTLTLQNACGTTSKAVLCKVLDRPGPPNGPLEVSGLSAEKCTLSWEPPLESGGAEVLYYIVEKCETSRVSWTLVYDDMMATTCKITKLLKGNEYLFRVKAVNKYGQGETLESEPTKAIDPFTIPSPPMDVEVSSATSETMTVCWKRPASDGGSRISGYIVEKREKQGVRWVRVTKKPVYDLRVKATCLYEGCEYEFRVFAENAAGLSEPSDPCPLTLAEDPKFLPSPPAKPTIVDSSRSSVTLSWNKPLFDVIFILSTFSRAYTG
uniref:Titin n=1 Tax=Gouania willdenowi TaxID=441366 RepID=A0A8C5DMY4_GOUWI